MPVSPVIEAPVSPVIEAPVSPVIEATVCLSEREIEVLACAAGGGCSRQIGRDLFVSRRTVEFHLGNAYAKLGVRNRLQALGRARRLGLLGCEAAGQTSDT